MSNTDAFAVTLAVLVAVLAVILVRQYAGRVFRDDPDEIHSCASCGREAKMLFAEGWLCFGCTLRRTTR
ncbi:MAG: hypothetical protein WC211_03795 [Dehalococcoidia bacterium]